MKTFNRIFFLVVSFGFLFADNKSDSSNFILNDPLADNDNGKEHPVDKLKQKLNDEKKLDKEKSENYDSLSLKIEAERREKTKKEEVESMSKLIKDLKKKQK
jgi:hypothetical protein